MDGPAIIGKRNTNPIVRDPESDPKPLKKVFGPPK